MIRKKLIVCSPSRCGAFPTNHGTCVPLKNEQALHAKTVRESAALVLNLSTEIERLKRVILTNSGAFTKEEIRALLDSD